jgi:hypothetical protein
MRLARKSGTSVLVRLGRETALSVLAAGLVVGLTSGCGPAPAGRWDSSPCETLDSLYASSGFEKPLSVAGQATVDANQFRMRGKIRLDARAPGELVFEFTSTILFGHEREDFVFSLVGDTLRIVDRERGVYHEGEDAGSFLAQSLETDLDIAWALWLAFGGHPPCDELSGIRVEMASAGEILCTGKRLGGQFRVVFGAGHRRLEEVVWPVRSDQYGVDRLRVEYEWETDDSGREVLDGLVVSLEIREWRCKIRASGTG